MYDIYLLYNRKLKEKSNNLEQKGIYNRKILSRKIDTRYKHKYRITELTYANSHYILCTRIPYIKFH